MNDERPLVSVVIAVKDGEDYLGEAIESVLAQGYPRLELIVVDGHSTDGSARVARSYPEVTYLEQDGTGIARAWNQAIGVSTGELIAFLDCDDRWTAGKLDAQLQLLEGHPEYAGAIGLVRFFLTPGGTPPGGLRPQLLEGEHVAHIPGALIVRREVFDQVGRFDPGYELVLDVDWFARLKDAGLELGRVPRVILEKRVHPGNLSHSQPDIYHREMVRAMRESATRQRAGGAR
jgi:glycosyltransferase involved in cell wall biosynthesis